MLTDYDDDPIPDRMQDIEYEYHDTMALLCKELDLCPCCYSLFEMVEMVLGLKPLPTDED